MLEEDKAKASLSQKTNGETIKVYALASNFALVLRFKNNLMHFLFMNNITLTMIKPEAVAKGYTGGMLRDISQAGFEIIALKMVQLTVKEAKDFYEVHRERPFYMELVNYMCQGPIVVAVLRKENAIEDFRTLIGATDPKKAKEGTLRKKYGTSLEENAIHGSDSEENAQVESLFHFAKAEIFDL